MYDDRSGHDRPALPPLRRRGRRWRVSFLAGIAAWIALCLSVAACGVSSSALGPSGGIRVVAAESFWGSIATQVGGSHVSVTSIIADPNTDPHNYEPTAADARIIADAQYVIINGAGYDPWAVKLLQANPTTGRTLLDVGAFNGKHAGDNPHLWYDPTYVVAVASRIRDDLKALDPGDASAIDHSAATFLTVGLKPYHEVIAAIEAKYSGTPVGATESIFSYLAPALGLRLITPYSYLKAVSEGDDIAAADEAAVEQQINQKQIKMLVYNAQNTPNNIQSLIALAHARGIPVASITETLTPTTASFQDWQMNQLRGIEAALALATGR